MVEAGDVHGEAPDPPPGLDAERLRVDGSSREEGALEGAEDAVGEEPLGLVGGSPAASATSAPPPPPPGAAAEYTAPPAPKAALAMGLRSTPKRTWPSLGRSLFGGGIRSHPTEAATRVPAPSRATHSAVPCDLDRVRRSGRASVGCLPSARTEGPPPVAAEVAQDRRKERSLVERERPPASSRRATWEVAVAI